ncbi:MAG: hypothetical protein J6O60_08355 [Lachnospiraceae bacterium]|nr:hypothetical protein [Lachnospiraceae bacterium]
MQNKKDNQELFDQQISDLLNSTPLSPPDDYESFIDDKIREGVESAKQQHKVVAFVRKHRKMIATFAIILGISAIGISTKATIDYYKDRMGKISESEKEETLERVEEEVGEAATFSREFTSNERERMKVLEEKYKNNGIFPEKKLKIIDSLDEVDESTICYYYPTRTYYLPDRELTDEELLEYIDDFEKTNYILQEQFIKEQESYADIEAIPDEDMKKIAIKAVVMYFDEKTENLLADIKWSYVYEEMEGGYTKDVNITVVNKNNSRFYEVHADGITGNINAIYNNCTLNDLDKTYPYAPHSKCEYSKEEICDSFKKNIDLACKCAPGLKCEGGAAIVYYGEGNVLGGTVLLKYNMEGGRQVEMTYVLKDGSIDYISPDYDATFETDYEFLEELSEKYGFEIRCTKFDLTK